MALASTSSASDATAGTSTLCSIFEAQFTLFVESETTFAPRPAASEISEHNLTHSARRRAKVTRPTSAALHDSMLRAALARLTAARPAPPVITRAFASGRSKRGIYAGKDIRFGNNISFSHRKTRRTFKPNAQRKRLWSETLGCWLRFNLTTHALRCIDRAGGIDAYLLKTPDAKLGSIAGANARRMIEAARAAEGGGPS